MKSVVFLNTPEIGIGKDHTHYAASSEFINGFSEYGYTPKVITHIHSENDLCGAEFILLSSHKINIEYYKKIHAIAPEATYILWFFHDYIDSLPFTKYILTGEYWYKPHRLLPRHQHLYNIQKTMTNYIPLLLRANESPVCIGKYTRDEKINGCFMGTPYKFDWVRGLDNVLYHNINIRKLLPYDKRREIYLQSKIAFGFHHDNNIINHHVTQRVFEALCYGCVVLSDNPAASLMTDEIVVYVKSKTDFLEKYNYYLTHPDECDKKRSQGYEWAKRYGTNRYSAKLFIDHSLGKTCSTIL